MARSQGVGFWYRIGWNLQYALLSLVGPAVLDERNDPRTRMQAERAERERLAALERGDR